MSKNRCGHDKRGSPYDSLDLVNQLSFTTNPIAPQIIVEYLLKNPGAYPFTHLNSKFDNLLAAFREGRYSTLVDFCPEFFLASLLALKTHSNEKSIEIFKELEKTFSLKRDIFLQNLEEIFSSPPFVYFGKRFDKNRWVGHKNLQNKRGEKAEIKRKLGFF